MTQEWKTLDFDERRRTARLQHIRLAVPLLASPTGRQVTTLRYLKSGNINNIRKTCLKFMRAKVSKILRQKNHAIVTAES